MGERVKKLVPAAQVLGILLLLLVALALISRGHGSRATTCPPLYTFTVNGHTVNVGGCSGHLTPGAGVPIQVHVGQTFTSRTFVPGQPLPTPANPAVVSASGDTQLGTYTALAPGTTPLQVRSIYCGSYPNTSGPSPTPAGPVPSPQPNPTRLNLCPTVTVHVLP